MAAKAASKPAAKTATKTTTKTATKTTTAKAAPAKTTLTPDPAPVTTTTPTPTASTTTSSIVPIVDRNPWGILALVLGIVGLGGVGTIIAAVHDKRNFTRDLIIGILQIVILFVGSVWGLVWGILIFVKGNK